jgi:L-aspartate oxidase
LAETTDVLIVGSGLAGMAAAIEAVGLGASVTMAWAGDGSSERAQGGVAAAIDPSDGPSLHASDTVAAGGGLCDPEAVALLTGEAPGAVEWLVGQGVHFDDAMDGGLALALEAAHSRPRVVHAGGDRSGAAIVAALRRRLEPVRPLEGAVLHGLLVDESGVGGGVFRSAGGPVEVRARATVLATGGYAGLYRRTVASPTCDGAPLAIALLAGAELADLEFVQFHPTAYAGPGAPFLVTEALRGAGAWLTDGSGRRFVFDWDPRGELAPRAVVSRAIAESLRSTGGRYVLLDARHLAAEVLVGHFGGFVANCGRVGLDPSRDLVPVAPAAHYTMGGIVTDTRGRTGVPGLLAAGECARAGVHGANRLASNSLLEAVVFGRRAGRAATLAERPQPGRRTRTLTPAEQPARDEWLRDLVEAHAGPLRDADGLRHGLAELAAAGGDGPAAEMLAKLIMDAALLREESRGAHVRTDDPAPSPAWQLQEIVAHLDDHAHSHLQARPRTPAAADRRLTA